MTIEGADGTHTHVLADGSVVTHRHDDGAHAHEHTHAHSHDEHHTHPHPHPPSGSGHIEQIQAQILSKNDLRAERNRGWFAGRQVLALNLMSSPGAGKTTLLERTLREIPGPVAVLEGDQETSRDAERIRATGAPAVQINTGTGCHLEADMVWHGLTELEPAAGSTLFIENVGNLVCPALFDLGEQGRVVLFSVTEGEDKPIKYPHMFRVADLVLLTKTDLEPHLDFDRGRALDAVRTVNPGAQVLSVSARTGVGLDAWYGWIASRRPAAQKSEHAR